MATIVINKLGKSIPQPRPISTGKVHSVSTKRVPVVVAPKRNMMNSAFIRSIGGNINCKRVK